MVQFTHVFIVIINERAKKYFGLKQKVKSEAAKQVVRDSHKYMKEVVMKEERFLSIRDGCLNRDRECAQLASEGQCDLKPEIDEETGEETFDDWMETNWCVSCCCIV